MDLTNFFWFAMWTAVVLTVGIWIGEARTQRRFYRRLFAHEIEKGTHQ